MAISVRKELAGGASLERLQSNVDMPRPVLLPGADLAEHFAVVEVVDIEQRTVMVLDGVARVWLSDCAYDGRVAGVVPRASEYRPAVVLDHSGQKAARKPLALVGRVFCRVDASHAAVADADLLTTSHTLGHAIKVLEPARVFGAVLGKATAALDDGAGLVPALVGLTSIDHQGPARHDRRLPDGEVIQCRH